MILDSGLLFLGPPCTYFVENFVPSLSVKECWKLINYSKLSTWV